MFVDEAKIYVRSGDGGSGCVSFRREKHVPRGGPDGGDGGDGGDVIFAVDPEMNTLLPFAGKHHWIAENGKPGEGSNCQGKNGRSLLINVPPGTIIHDDKMDLRIKELLEADQKVVLLKGGTGGLGNRHFASPTRQTPRHATPGQPGQERWLRLELKLIADVGLVGLPNAGKSTLLSRTSRARPKIADYPFTTLAPQLGIVSLSSYRQYVMADIPGLIEGAHEGIGLGDTFLRHIERTRIILHMIDIAPLEGLPRPWEAYEQIRKELEKYSPALAAKREIVVANKMDLVNSEDEVIQLQKTIGKTVHSISAVTGSGIDRLNSLIWSNLQEQKSTE